jgi:predicted transcriptional regulator
MLAAALIVASAAISMYSASKQGEAEKESLDREIEYNGLLLAEEERKSIETIKMVTAKIDNILYKI